MSLVALAGECDLSEDNFGNFYVQCGTNADANAGVLLDAATGPVRRLRDFGVLGVVVLATLHDEARIASGHKLLEHITEMLCNLLERACDCFVLLSVQGLKEWE